MIFHNQIEITKIDTTNVIHMYMNNYVNTRL